MIYKCPVCSNALFKHEQQFVCDGSHSFDIAKEGYVNLLGAANKPARDQGDSQEMIVARRAFLREGYYEPLRNELVKILLSLPREDNFSLIDSACGEGYYLKGIHEATGFDCHGFDLSKPAIKRAAKDSPSCNYSIANIFHLPVLDKSADGAISIFAPVNEKEMARILKTGSPWIIVSPGTNHLYELKAALYKTVAVNEKGFELQQFKTLKTIDLNYTISVDTKSGIRNLIAMTPYFWKTDKRAIDTVVSSLNCLQTRLEFSITIAQLNESKTSKRCEAEHTFTTEG